MIVNISWIQFQQHFLKTSDFVYVNEEADKWVLYVTDKTMTIKSVVQKSEVMEENAMFVDRYLNDSNIIKVEWVVEHEPVKLRLVQE